MHGALEGVHTFTFGAQPSVQAALAAMMQLELPHVNVLTKMDLMKRSSAEVEQYVPSTRHAKSQPEPRAPQVSSTRRAVLLA